jgi:hypothetical protein
MASSSASTVFACSARSQPFTSPKPPNPSASRTTSLSSPSAARLKPKTGRARRCAIFCILVNSLKILPSNLIVGQAFATARLLFVEAFAFLTLIAGVIYLFKTNPSGLHWTQGYNPTGSFLFPLSSPRCPSSFSSAPWPSCAQGARRRTCRPRHCPARRHRRLPHARAARLHRRRLWRWLRHLSPLLDHSSRHLSLRPHRPNRPLSSRCNKSHRHHRRQPPAASPHRLRPRSFFEGTSGFGTPVAVCAAILISLGFRPLRPRAFRSSPTPRRSPSEPWAFPSSRCTASPASIFFPHQNHRRHPRAIRRADSLLAHLGLRRIHRHDRNLAGDPRRRRHLRRRAISSWPLIRTLRSSPSSPPHPPSSFWSSFSASGSRAARSTSISRHHRRGSPPSRPQRCSHLQRLASLARIEPRRLPLGPAPHLFWMDAHTTIKFAVAGLTTRSARSARRRRAHQRSRHLQSQLAHRHRHRNPLAASSPACSWDSNPHSLTAAFAHHLQHPLHHRHHRRHDGLGYITRYCGLDATLGLAFARTGALYPFFGTLIGWLGTASTGSDTSSNVLFGSLQTMTARQIGVSPILMASANSAGGVMGKMIAAPSIVVASTATKLRPGRLHPPLRLFSLLALAALAGIAVTLLAYVPLLIAG